MSYFATKGLITKTIKKNMRKSYEKMGWAITTDGNNPYDPYDYDEVTSNRLEPIIINGESFEGYSSFQCINTKTYVQEPVRTLDGSIPNINDYATFIVPRVQVSFDYMSIGDFRRFLKAITPNEFDVTYYDYEIDRVVTRKMYIEPREMSKIFNKGYEILAVTGEKISLIGTLNDEQDLSIRYFDNVTYKELNSTSEAEGYILFEEQRVLLGNWYYILDGNQFSHNKKESDKKKYTFSHWNTRPDGTGIKYDSLTTVQLIDSLVLYAQWIESESDT